MRVGGKTLRLAVERCDIEIDDLVLVIRGGDGDEVVRFASIE